MSDSTATLQEAYELIELGKFAEAREILKPYVEDRPSPDVLWVYMHAVEDPDEGKRVLSQLNAIAPDYPGINKFNADLGFEVTETQPISDQQMLGSAGPSSEHELEDFADNGNDRRVPILAMLVSVIIVVAVILVLVNPFGNDSGEQPSTTQVADNVADDSITPEVTVDPTPSLSAEATTVTSSQSEDNEESLNPNSIEALFADFDLAPSEASFQEETELGNTIFVRLCSVPGPVAAAHIANAMNVFASMQEIDSDAVGVVIQNCDSETDLRYIAVSVSDLNAYANGEITEAEFNRLLRPVR